MKRFGLLLLLIVVASFLVFFSRKKEEPASTTASLEKEGLPLLSPPPLLPARELTTDSPLFSWERLLVEDGSATEDRDALQEIVTSFLQSTPPGARPPLGPNEEFTRALSDPETMGGTAIPPDHPAIRDGELIDRWGTPWLFHQESSGAVGVRSAGPDRSLFTGDDIAR